MVRKVKDWCNICRVQKADICCSNEGCDRRFHSWCLTATESWNEDTDNFICPDCQSKRENSCTCYICNEPVVTGSGNKKRSSGEVVWYADSIDTSNILLCDGCSSSAHIKCLGLKTPILTDDNELWYCTLCDPHGETAKQMNKKNAAKRTVNNTADDEEKIGGNVDICYVCQKEGRLLGCDFCEQSYHPRCIDTGFLEFESGKNQWECPICRGEDPLKSLGTRRLSRTAMARLMNDMQQCIHTQYRLSSNNRDKFLWENREELRPFMNEKAYARLQNRFSKFDTSSQALENSDTDPDSDVEQTSTKSLSNSLLTTSNDNSQITFYEYFDKASKLARNGVLREGVKLKSYQKYGVEWLLQSFFTRAGAILADEMGLGKTIQCLAFLSALKALGITGPHLIVVPLSTVGNWAREIRRFVPNLSFVKICGSKFERDHIMDDPASAQGLHDLYITTYETSVTEESFFCDNFDWQCIILDEAHRIKNSNGRIRNSLNRVSSNMRVLLTGTPLQNNVKELFTLLNFLFPDILKNSEEFEKLSNPVSFNSSNSGGSRVLGMNMDGGIIEGLSHMLSKLMLRRTKKLVVQLPKKIEHDIWLPLSQTAAMWYKRLLDVSDAAFKTNSVRKILGAVVKMRICTCHPCCLVALDKQLEKFKEIFQAIGGDESLIDAATQLQKLSNEEHILASNKLVALDKLLLQLHLENCKYDEAYKNAYIQNVIYLHMTANPLIIGLPPTKAEIAAARREATILGNTKTESGYSLTAGAGGFDGFGESKTDVKNSKSSKDSPESAASQAKPMSSRQVAERARRERAAYTNKVQKEYDEYCMKLALSKLEELSKLYEPNEMLESAMMVADLTKEEKTNASAESGNVSAEDSDNEDTISQAKAKHVANEQVIDDATEVDENESSKDAKTEDEEEVNEENDKSVNQVKRNSFSSKPQKPQRFSHKVLVFSQFQLVLDELERYCKYRGFKYLRLDGSTNKMIRELDIREFNSDDSTHLIYLICTRAGGVGINLVSANHVVLYDEDWNPFMDLQAIDRAHRIGQKRNVHVWKLITEWTIEERMAFRRMQKLQLDKIFIQSATSENGGSELTDEQKAGSVDSYLQKMDVNEIHKLTRFAREALKPLIASNESIADLSLNEIIERKRQDLPETLQEFSEKDDLSFDVDFNDSNAQVDLKPTYINNVDIIKEIDNCDSINLNKDLQQDTEYESESASATSTVDPSNLTQSNEEQTTGNITSDTEPLRKSRTARLRKKVRLFAPVVTTTTTKKEEHKMLHEKRCFKCGSGNNTLDDNADPLIPCHRCPRVYHMRGCLGLTEPPRKTWVCLWHECCLCFRKGSQAGGILIHCAECPTTFCFDCFPPEYRRYHPPVTYFSELRKRGFNATPEKMIIFLCSRCKAYKEQQRRRQLTKQQAEAEMQARREIQARARLETERKRAKEADGDIEAAVALATALSKRGGDIKKNFLNRKRARDDQDKRITERMKDAYVNLYSDQFYTLLNEQKVTSEDSCANGEKVDDDKPDEIKNQNSNFTDLTSDQDNLGESITTTKTDMPTDDDVKEPIADSNDVKPNSDKLDVASKAGTDTNTTGADSSKSRNKSSKSLVVKPPRCYLKLCMNCHLPGHDMAGCPFPSEVNRKSKSSEAEATAATAPVTEEDATQNTKSGSSQKQRVVTRSFCPKCGVSSRNHLRRHCELLTDSEIKEYADRLQKTIAFIEKLEAHEQISFPSDGSIDYSRYSSAHIRKLFIRFAEVTLHECLVEAGLENCSQNLAKTKPTELFPTLNEGSGRTKEKNSRKRNYDYSDDNYDEVDGDDEDFDENLNFTPINKEPVRQTRNTSKPRKIANKASDDINNLSTQNSKVPQSSANPTTTGSVSFDDYRYFEQQSEFKDQNLPQFNMNQPRLNNAANGDFNMYQQNNNMSRFGQMNYNMVNNPHYMQQQQHPMRFMPENQVANAQGQPPVIMIKQPIEGNYFPQNSTGNMNIHQMNNYYSNGQVPQHNMYKQSNQFVNPIASPIQVPPDMQNQHHMQYNIPPYYNNNIQQQFNVPPMQQNVFGMQVGPPVASVIPSDAPPNSPIIAEDNSSCQNFKSIPGYNYNEAN